MIRIFRNRPCVDCLHACLRCGDRYRHVIGSSGNHRNLIRCSFGNRRGRIRGSFSFLQRPAAIRVLSDDIHIRHDRVCRCFGFSCLPCFACGSLFCTGVHSIARSRRQARKFRIILPGLSIQAVLISAACLSRLCDAYARLPRLHLYSGRWRARQLVDRSCCGRQPNIFSAFYLLHSHRKDLFPDIGSGSHIDVSFRTRDLFSRILVRGLYFVRISPVPVPDHVGRILR